MTFDEWYSSLGLSYQRLEKVLMEKAWNAALAAATEELRWIPMKERQPADFEAVLCVNSNGWMTVANRFHDTHLGCWNGSHVSAEDGPLDDALVIGDITHWQPLPALPSPQREPT